MKHKFKHIINRMAIYLAGISFILGTLLLLIHKIKLWGSLIYLGLNYVGFATAVNTLMLLILLANSVTNYKDYKENLISICILLTNIPITLFYINLI